MHVATFFVDSAALRDRRPWVIAAVVSLLLHAGMAWWLFGAPWWWSEKQAEPQSMVVEMVTLPPPAPPAPPPEPVIPSLPVIPPPPPPQLSEAPIAERSAPPPAPRPAPQQARPRTDTTTVLPGQRSTAALPRSDSGESALLEAGRARPGGAPKDSVASQTVQDVILRQIARHWIIDVRGPTYRDVVLTVRFKLLPDGMLAPPFGRNDPWDLKVMVRDYDVMMKPENRMIRTTIETFLQAMREAQPFQLPPDGRSDEERVLPLSFRLGDL